MKKLLLNMLVLAVATIVGVSQAFAADYSDLQKSHWAYKYINELTKEKVLYGYPDGTFRPDELATRAEFATMVVKSLHQEDYPIKETIDFSDVPKDYWAWGMIQRGVTFDMIKGVKDSKFRPEDSVTRAEAITVAINALTTENISMEKAKEVLNAIYTDAAVTQEWFIITAGKAQILGLITKIPGAEKLLNGEKPATRADLAVLLFKMREEAKLNPNAKLREAMRPKKADGYILESATLEGYIATIPAGTKIPVQLNSKVSSQVSKSGDAVVAKMNQNIVSKENYVIFAKGCEVSANVLDVKKAYYIFRNGKLSVNTKTITTLKPQTAQFVGLFADDKVTRNFWQKLVRWVIKGQKVKFNEGDIAYIELLKPLKVDLTNGWIME